VVKNKGDKGEGRITKFLKKYKEQIKKYDKGAKNDR